MLYPTYSPQHALSLFSSSHPPLQLRTRRHILLQPSLHRLQILLRNNPIPPPLLPTRQRQVLRHDAIQIHSLHTRPLQTLRPGHHILRAVELPPLDQPTSPREDGRDGVGGGFAAGLVFAEVARYGAVGGFGFEGVAVGGY